MRRALFVLALSALASSACGEADPVDAAVGDASAGDTGTTTDSGTPDARLDAGFDGGADGASMDGAGEDAGLDGGVDAEPDDAEPADTEPDAGPGDALVGDGGPTPAECDPATVLDLNLLSPAPGTTFTITVDTSSLAITGDLPAPSCQTDVGFVQVFRYVPQTDSRLYLSTENPGTSFDTVLWALAPCAVDALELGCSDDTESSFGSSLIVAQALAGVPIYVAVGGYGAPTDPPESGQVELSVLEETIVLGPCNFAADPICPPATRCNGRSLTPGVDCVPALPLGAFCDPLEFLPSNTCAAPNVCNVVSTSTISRCVAPPYAESQSAATFIDACANGTVLAGLTDLDDGNAFTALPIPFTFDFFGTGYTEIWPSTNGYAVLGPNAPANSTFGPPSFGEGPAIAPFWDDLALDNTGARICYQEIGTDQFVIEWQNAYRVGRLGPPGNQMQLTFELILNAADGSIDFVYSTLEPSNGPSSEVANGLNAHVGVQSAFAAEWAIHDGPVAIDAPLHFAP